MTGSVSFRRTCTRATENEKIELSRAGRRLWDLGLKGPSSREFVVESGYWAAYADRGVFGVAQLYRCVIYLDGCGSPIGVRLCGVQERPFGLDRPEWVKSFPMLP
jgi:hypothetical protein